MSELTFETDLEAAPEQVWRALTVPELREAWLGAPETGEAEVAVSDPPSRLDLLWPTPEGESMITFEIAPREAGGARLTVVHRTPTPARQATPAGGWRMAA